MSTATPTDVTGVIETDLTTSEIQNYLDDAEFKAQQAIADYSTALTTAEKTQLEKYLAALLIRQFRDRAIQSGSRETASVNYEGMSIAALQREVDARDPSGTLAYQRDTDRFVSSTTTE